MQHSIGSATSSRFRFPLFRSSAVVPALRVPCHCRRSPPCKCHSNIEKLCEPRPWRTGLPTPKASFANAQKRPPSIHANIEPCRMQQPLASSPRLKNCRPSVPVARFQQPEPQMRVLHASKFHQERNFAKVDLYIKKNRKVSQSLHRETKRNGCICPCTRNVYTCLPASGRSAEPRFVFGPLCRRPGSYFQCSVEEFI